MILLRPPSIPKSIENLDQELSNDEALIISSLNITFELLIDFQKVNTIVLNILFLLFVFCHFVLTPYNIFIICLVQFNIPFFTKKLLFSFLGNMDGWGYRSTYKKLYYRVKSVPLRNHPIGCKWVFTLKYHLDDTFTWYKVKLVVKGFT